ncbi:hypothetical protein [Varunaivibrio sulfuroxidans]|uniref:Cell division and transport-associated protein TolA n=1 Tax=Varunaivibrio sulfuroxidans TaxID=1773489 RepID=A0A4V2UNS3_9PROT|nr:hypothetical protein [Varunaivibrio sulfuroxidans]TCS63151.1 cell division and transport-associated protein TolA [Varunaivibrio sulfuroxidans]WES31784.1 hypothetical protein P3M64_05340 [Varunaivibrio sulfuroxidans]
MYKNLALSVGIHTLVLALAYFGLPMLHRPVQNVDVPVFVDVLTVADKTNVGATRPKPEKADVKPVKKTEAVKKTPPPKVKPKASPPPKPKPKPKASPPPKPKASPPPKPKAPPVPKAPKAVAAPPSVTQVKAKKQDKPKPKPKPEPKPKPKPKKKPAPDPFASVLHTVEKLNAPPPPKVEKKQVQKSAPAKTSFADKIAKVLQKATPDYMASQPLTISEKDLVRRQIAQCWNPPAGAKNAQDMIITIAMAMNPDGTVREARLEGAGQMRSDPFYRAMAESALRAVLNPRCSPFKLPPEKYATWQKMTLTFNPKEMFGL